MNEATAIKKLNAASDRIGGYTGALAFLEKLPDEVARKVLKPAMKAADLVGKNAAEAEMRAHTSDKPKRGGALHLVTTTGAAEATLGGTVVGKVGFFGQAGSAAWLVEHGHRMVVGGTVVRLTGKQKGRAPYVWKTDADGKKVLSEKTGAGTIVKLKSGAGEVPPHPVLAPAYEKAKAGMEQVFAAEVITRADRVAANLAKQTGAL